MATKAAITSAKKSTSTVTKSISTTYRSICKTMKGMPIIGALIVEFIGAFILTASFIEMQGNPLFFGFALVGVVLVVGSVTGANPAMTIGSWITRKINWVQALGYIAAQFLGAAVAYWVLNAFLTNSGSSSALGASPSLFHAAEIVKNKEWYIFFAELLGTSVLAMGIATAARVRTNKIVSAFSAGLAVLVALYIAMSLTTVLLTAQGVTLSFLNPAIAIVANGLNGLSWSNMWTLSIFVVAPVLGGIIGFTLQDFLHCINSENCDCDYCK